MFFETWTKAFLARVMPLLGPSEVRIGAMINRRAKSLLKIKKVDPPLGIDAYGWGWKMAPDEPFFNKFPGEGGGVKQWLSKKVHHGNHFLLFQFKGLMTEMKAFEKTKARHENLTSGSRNRLKDSSIKYTVLSEGVFLSTYIRFTCIPFKNIESL